MGTMTSERSSPPEVSKGTIGVGVVEGKGNGTGKAYGGETTSERTSCECSRRPEAWIQREDGPEAVRVDETVTRRNSAVFWSTPEEKSEVPVCEFWRLAGQSTKESQGETNGSDGEAEHVGLVGAEALALGAHLAVPELDVAHRVARDRKSVV